MPDIRIIPRLDIKGPNLVKGIHLEGLRVLGRPEQFAKYYYENGADELMYIDVVASLYERNSLADVITKTAKEIFIPLTVGGGLRTTEDIKKVLRAGADKVSINTAAINNPDFIGQAARIFGSSTIVVAIEATKNQDGSYFAYTDNGREATGVEVIGWAIRAEELGAGEIVITSVDREGTGLGFDIDLVKRVAESVSIPVVAHGGAGKKEDVLTVIVRGKASAVALSSILHYDYISKNKIEGDYHKEGNTEFVKSGKAFSNISPIGLTELKNYLHQSKINCRYKSAGKL